ncbi:MAG: hypothetical protein H6836_06525 [Planctomycetes bacterium]|nr:hypothetical protein [Planctomycetota bacterium]
MAFDGTELERVAELPLWAQVLIAARMARRAALATPNTVSEKTRTLFLAGCEAIELCAVTGQWRNSEKRTMRRAEEQSMPAQAYAASCVFHHAAAATHAASDSLDFSAAETACVNSVCNALVSAFEIEGTNPLQIRILVAADLDLLRFACQENRISRYDALGSAVLGRLPPAGAP